ncbi:MFS general substrate transporter [Wallemia mellicola]|uniref:MFS general substrate transporter n=1 Tax=Wallemia mellicola TaxID=1708541 RepID=A0A4T0NY18_9BASI|nr:MFS general substrate transporter [Wallemia mellicola]
MSDKDITTFDKDTEKNSELFLVDSLEGDSPKLWPAWKRWSLTVFVGIIAIASAMASAGTTGVAEDIMAEFDFTDKIEATLCLSVYMLGYVLGPIWGPASEAFGRKYTLIFCLWVLTLFNIADAVSSTPEALYVCRFFAGFFGGCMIIVVGPCIGDMFTAKDKQIALAIYACCPYLGPSIAPIVSGFIHDSGTSWRWMFGVLAIFSGSCAILALFILPETYEPVLLVWKAKKLRKETQDTRYVAPKELQTKGMSGVMNDIFTKPFVMLAYEPMLAALSFYSAFVYGVQYLLFEAFQFVYSAEKGGHDMSNGVRGLCFIPLSLGSVIAAMVTALFFNRRYIKRMNETGEKPPPEIRLEGACLGGIFGIIFFFWFGWTSYPWISPWSPIIASTLWGAAQCMVYLAQVSYINDCYTISAASALSGLVMCRSLFAFAFPLFANKMYEGIGPRWACTILGIVQIVLAIVPWVLIYKGPAFRARSKFGE